MNDSINFKSASTNNNTNNNSSSKLAERIAEHKKNIREIYLQSLKSKKNIKRKENFTNLKTANDSSTSQQLPYGHGSSSYLEKEYNLVQRIIQDTKELKSIKLKNKQNREKKKVAQSAGALGVPVNKSSFTYKTQEEYYQEVLELKKALKQLQQNELVMKSKLEYYENELAKKEQELIALYDNKNLVQTINNSKSDPTALVYSLKQKCYKLEVALKKKENELSELKNDLKTTNIKELKAQNERLSLELSKAFMNDTKILDAIEESEHLGLGKRLEDVSSSDIRFVHSSESFKTNIKQKIAQRCLTEPSEEKENGQVSSSESHNSRPSSRSSSVAENKKLRSLKKLQSIMRGHLERSNSLKHLEEEESSRNKQKNEQREGENKRKENRRRESSRDRRSRNSLRSASSSSSSSSTSSWTSSVKKDRDSPFLKHSEKRRENSSERSKNKKKNYYSNNNDDAEDSYRLRKEREKSYKDKEKEKERDNLSISSRHSIASSSRYSERSEYKKTYEKSPKSKTGIVVSNSSSSDDERKGKPIKPKEVKKVDSTGCCSSMRVK